MSAPQLTRSASPTPVQMAVRGLICLSATLLAGCSNCDEFADFGPWHPTIVSDAKAATLPPEDDLAAPDCDIKGATKPSKASGNPAAFADPNLLEVARLEVERDCYKDAEESLRERLQHLEESSVGRR